MTRWMQAKRGDAESDADAWHELERWLDGYSFSRTETRRAMLKRLCDCGHWIDGSEPYRYMVWMLRRDRVLTQRTDCQFCARVDEGRA